MYSGYSLEEIIDKYLNGKASKEECVLIEKWFEAVDANQQNIPTSSEQKEKLFQELLTRTQNTDAEEAKIVEVDFKHIKKPKTIGFSWRIAASVLVLMGISMAGYFILKTRTSKDSGNENQLFTIRTKVGEVKEIVLPDSSHVWLNANATLSYRSGFLENRELQLEGEALFEVTHDTLHPFSVQTTDGFRVKVLGTRFDLCSYVHETNTRLTVIRGHVSFANKEKVLDTLSKGDIGNYDKATWKYHKSYSEDASKVEGWVSGQWQFDNMNVNDLARLLYDQYGVKLIIKKEALQKITMNANFTKSQSSEDIIKVYSTLVQCKYKWAGKSVIVLY